MTDAMTLEAVRAGGKRALAAALARLESAPDSPGITALLDAALAEPTGVAIGLTGPPGVGKSTLTDALIRHWRGTGRTVGVIAVDPSSQKSGGALLGDRTRLSTDPTDQGIFVRSMAARDQLGGLAAITFPAMVLMRALFDVVLIETVGVGQSETAIADTADLVALCAQPGSGDALQYMKAGIMEVPDLIVVTKADMGAVARRTLSDLRGGLSLGVAEAPAVLSCAAATGEGVAEVAGAIDARAAAAGAMADRRRAQANRWVRARLASRFGSIGLELLDGMAGTESKYETFRRASELDSRLSAAIIAAFR